MSVPLWLPYALFLAVALGLYLLRHRRRHEVHAQELKDAVAGMLTERQQARADDGTVAGMLNSDAFLHRPMLRRAEFDAKLQALTVEQVNAAIRKFLKPAELSVFEAGDWSGQRPAVAAGATTP